MIDVDLKNLRIRNFRIALQMRFQRHRLSESGWGIIRRTHLDLHDMCSIFLSGLNNERVRNSVRVQSESTWENNLDCPVIFVLGCSGCCENQIAGIKEFPNLNLKRVAVFRSTRIQCIRCRRDFCLCICNIKHDVVRRSNRNEDT